MTNFVSFKQSKDNKLKLLELFGGKCVLCGYSRCPSALHFHHVDETTKLFSIGSCGLRMDILVEEAKKCALVCGNCHSEIHAGLIANLAPTPMIGQYTPTLFGDVSKIIPLTKLLVESIPGRICSCGATITTTAKHCKRCTPKKDKITWPSQEELIQLVRLNGYSETGRILGVTDNAVRKRIKTGKVGTAPTPSELTVRHSTN